MVAYTMEFILTLVSIIEITPEGTSASQRMIFGIAAVSSQADAKC